MGNKNVPDTWLFKQTFAKLTVSPQIIQEVIDMTETKKRPKRFILRRLIVAALVLALAFALAMGANAATDGGLFKSMFSFVTYTEDGQAIAIGIDAECISMAEDGLLYTITEDGKESATVAYRDSEGNFVLDDFRLPEDITKIVGVGGIKDGSAAKEESPAAGPDVEAEANKGATA